MTTPITFSELPLRQNRRTKEWSVWDHHFEEQLGVIKWVAPWRQYCFFAISAVYSLSRLQDIASFLEERKETP